MIQLTKSTDESRDFLQELEDAYKDQEENYEFIWGIKTCDCIAEGKADFYTTNDIGITYDKKQKTYSIGIETGYDFKVGSDGERGYILSLFDEMTKWMQEQGYKTDIRPYIYNIFGNGYNINTDFNSIEELYTTFKCLVKGFCTNT